jgi:hypothetical protein
MLRRVLTPASDTGRQQSGDLQWAANELNRSLDVVLGNVAVLVTQLDPSSSAHGRAWHALNEAKRTREVINHLVETAIQKRLRDAA